MTASKLVTFSRGHMKSHLTFDFGFFIDGAQPRPVQYLGGMYQPDYLRFELVSAGLHDGEHPRYEDLRVKNVVLHGKKLKKDGTPGTLDKHENFYTMDIPKWAMEIVEREAAKLKENREG